MRIPRLAFAAIALLFVAQPATGAESPSDDPYAAQQWALEEIQAPEAWDTATGHGAIVAVVDSGIDLTHPDLRANISRTGVDLVDGGRPDDEFGHGTHVAGIIAAVTDNGRGIAGIAPSAKLMSVRVLDENNAASAEDVSEGIRWAADHGADVINVSIGYGIPGYGQYYAALLDHQKKAIEHAWKKGAVVVLAAGNTYQPLCDQPMTPALCVGATGAFEEKTHYSNFDATMTENYLVAPGGETVVVDCAHAILSTWSRDHSLNGPCDPGEGYAVVGGTSMAAPMVSGVAALLAGQGASNAEIVETILSTTDDLGTPGRDPVFGYGRVNALKAVTKN